MITRLSAVFAACAAPRLCALWLWPPDTGTLYFQLAAGLAAHGSAALLTDVGARIEPLYPALLAAGGVAHPRALLVTQVVLASAAGVLVFLLAQSLWTSSRAAWIAAGLYAVSPYLIRQSAAFMEVTLAASLLVACAWTMTRRGTLSAVAAGALFAAAVLTRASFLPIAAGGLVLLARTNLRSGAAATVACTVCLAAWIGYARGAGASPFPARAGENLFVSTNEWARAVVPQTNNDVLLPLVDAIARDTLRRRGIDDPSEAELDGVKLDEALAFARAHPWQTIALKLRNAAFCLQPRLLPFTERRGSAELVDGTLRIPPQAPRPLAFEIGAGLFQAVILAGAAAGLWKRRYHLGGADAFPLLVAGSILAANIVFFPTSRLLAPMTFVLMLYTAVNVER